MISFFGCSLLILVGLLCHKEVVTAYRPSLKIAMDALSPVQAPIGAFSFVYGIYSIIQTLSHFKQILQSPFLYLSTLAFGFVCITAGGVLGYTLLRFVLSRKLPSQRTHLLEKLDILHEKLVKEQKTIAYAALALGIFHALLVLLPARMVSAILSW